ncbi:MAG: patatin-like phospholipase family protein [Holosporaceae bacterium]|jgi:hypothetical protein|nr:patatin-like phospholipase family protein [Holosporaceae bacterium]
MKKYIKKLCIFFAVTSIFPLKAMLPAVVQTDEIPGMPLAPISDGNGHNEGTSSDRTVVPPPPCWSITSHPPVFISARPPEPPAEASDPGDTMPWMPPGFATTEVRTILVLDGGGCRGIIPLRYVLKLGLTSDNVDMFVGTSVGALIGAALMLDKQQTLYDHFPGLCQEIFRRNSTGLFSPRYSSETLLNVLRRFVDHRMTFSQLKGDSVITWYDAARKSFAAMLSWSTEAAKMALVNAIASSSAAPTYFCAQEGRLDGGLAANTPIDLGILAARNRYPEALLNVIHLGTGAELVPQGVPRHGEGMIGWAPMIIDTLFDAQASASMVRAQMTIDNDGRITVVHLNPVLLHSEMDMNDCSAAAYDGRIAAAEAYTRVGAPGEDALARALEMRVAADERFRQRTAPANAATGP